MTHPAISVVVPAYNNARTLEETLRSILGQDFEDFELLVADHSSTDDTLQVMSRFAGDPRVRLLTTDAGGGAERNWNRVTAEASGEYLKLVCGDDVLLPGTLSRQYGLLTGSGAVLTACKRNVVDAQGRTLIAAWGLRGLNRRMPGTAAVRACVRAGSNLLGEPASVLMRRDALEAVGGWDGTFPYLIDQATYSRVLLRGNFVPDLAVGATFRMSDTQWSVALTRDQSSQARGFHARLRAEHPTVISAWDRRIGDLRARVMANARRLSYRVLQRRMR